MNLKVLIMFILKNIYLITIFGNFQHYLKAKIKLQKTKKIRRIMMVVINYCYILLLKEVLAKHQFHNTISIREKVQSEEKVEADGWKQILNYKHTSESHESKNRHIW